MIERICIILLANFLFFFKTLGYKYASDDIPAYNRPKDKVRWKQWLWVLEGRARHSPQVDHVITIIIHALTCVFIFTGFGAVGHHYNMPHAYEVSFIASLLFMVNPINNQASVWIAGRGYAFPTLGLTMILTCPYLAPIVMAGVMYYPCGFAMPMILLASPYPWTALAMIVGLALHFNRFKRNVSDKINKEMFGEDKKFGWFKIVLAIKTFGYYTIHSLIPFRTSFYHSFLQSAAGSGKSKAYSMKDRFFFIGVILIVAAIYRVTTTPWGPVNFAILWWFMGISPFLNMFRINQEIAERYTYLPNAGLMFVMASILHGHPIAVAVFTSIYATKMWFYMDAYQDDYFLVEQACLNSPDAWFAWHVRAMKRWDNKSYQEAVILWTMARLISPKEFKLNLNIATACMMSNHKKEGLEYLKVAEDNIPSGQENTAKELIADFRKGNLVIVL